MADRDIARTLLVDADDTLWENNIFYLRCTDRFLQLVVSRGYDAERARSVLAECEHDLIPEWGYGPLGYIEALGRSYERLAREAGQTPDNDTLAAARSMGRPILVPPMVLLDDVEMTLTALRPTSRLVLVTKGDEKHQARKIERSGLASLFDAQYIVQEKDADVYRRVVQELDADPSITWMVGNSPKSDINPAVAAGLAAILIPHDNTWTAEHQALEHPESVVTLARFCELLDFFDIDGECTP